MLTAMNKRTDIFHLEIRKQKKEEKEGTKNQRTCFESVPLQATPQGANLGKEPSLGSNQGEGANQRPWNKNWPRLSLPGLNPATTAQ